MKTIERARVLAHVTGLVNQQLLLQNEYLAAENRILSGVDMRQSGNRLVKTEMLGNASTVKIATNVGKMTSNLHMWLSPSLGCELLHQEIELRDNRGVFIGTSVKELESLRLGEPDDALFAVPEAYAEVLPSELNLRVGEKLTGKRSVCNPQMQAAMDKKYFSHRP